MLGDDGARAKEGKDLAAREGGGYTLDGEFHEDDVHVLRLQMGGLVVAKGANEFGPFVSIGRLEGGLGRDDDQTLTLARRYLDERDERAKWTIEQLLEAIDEADVTACAAPWQRAGEAIMGASVRRKRKRKA